MPRIALIIAVVIVIGSIGYTFYQQSPVAVALKTDALPSKGAGDDNTIIALEQRTGKNSADVEGWQLLGWSYFEAGRYQDSARAYERATKLSPDRAIYWSSLGEALVMASDRDPMPAAAKAAFEKAVALDAKDPRGRYFVAVSKDLSGDHNGATDDWLALLQDTPKGAPWESDLVLTIQQVAKINKLDIAARIKAAQNQQLQPADRAVAAPNSIAAAAIPGPSRAQMAQAASLPTGQQQEMVQSMVSGLEAKLAKDPRNVPGWIMLMRSRTTLGQPAKASAAFKSAVAANPVQKQQLEAEAQVLGVATR